ncbi:hypothetical protein G7Y79_00014g037040 [Physcia stellaris]|nr:hypothetical protein G7Y79_00014g037040 [Physcia stellaris]
MKCPYFIIAFNAYSALALAVAGEVQSRTTPSTSCNSRNFLDTFDERKALPVSAGPATAVGIEGALNYSTFTLSDDTLALLIKPPSKPNFAAAGLLDQLTSGGQAQLLPANSTVQYFNFESLAYACVTNANPAPISCTIHVIGIKGKAYGGGQVTQDLIFNPGPVVTGGVAKQFATSTFPQPSFAGLVALTLSITSAATSSATNINIDNVGYHACIGK